MEVLEEPRQWSHNATSAPSHLDVAWTALGRDEEIACTCDITYVMNIVVRTCALPVLRKQKNAYVRCVQSVLAVLVMFIVPNNVPIVGHTYVRIGTYAYRAYVRSTVHIAQPAALPIDVRTAVPIAVPTYCCAH